MAKKSSVVYDRLDHYCEVGRHEVSYYVQRCFVCHTAICLEHMANGRYVQPGQAVACSQHIVQVDAYNASRSS